MVLQVLYTAATSVLPFKYWPYAAVAAAVLVVIYAYAQGRSTSRERDLHARVILLTVSGQTPFVYALWDTLLDMFPGALLASCTSFHLQY